MGAHTDSPSMNHVLSSRQAPDGTKRFGFFHPELKGARKEWAKLTFMTYGMITVFMFLFLSIYFGSYYLQIPRADHFDIEVVDLDSAASAEGVPHPALLGPAIRSAIIEAEATEPHLGWYETDPTTLRTFRLTEDGQGIDPFEYGKMRINNQGTWGVLIVNANATRGVWEALTAGTAWEPTGAITFIYGEARNFYAADQYVQRLSTQLMTAATASAGTQLGSFLRS